MKRALIVLLLLAVAAGGLFAQQITFSGWVRSGLQIAIPDEGDPTFHLYDATPGSRYRAGFYGSYTNEAGNAGASFGLQSTFAGTDGSGEFARDGANVWARPSDTVLLRFGTGGPGGFGTLGGFDWAQDAADGFGFHMVFGPFSGLRLAASIKPNNVPPADGVYAFGVRYTAAGTFDVVGNLRYNGAGNEGDGKVDAGAGFDFVGLSSAGLTKLAVDVVAQDVTEDLLWVGVGPRVNFRVDNVTDAGNLTGQLRPRIFLPMGDNSEDLKFAVYAQVGLPIVTGVSANLDVGYETATVLRGNPGSGAIRHFANYDGLQSAAYGTGAYSAGNSIFLVTPTVAFSNVGGARGATLTTGFTFQTQMGDVEKTQTGLFCLFNVSF